MSIIKPEQLRSGSYSISGSFSGSFQGDGTNVTGVISASYAQNADLLDGRDSTTYANTGSNVFVGQQIITGSVYLTGSQTIDGSLNVTSATGSFTGSFFGNGSGIFSGSFSGSITSNLQDVTDNGSVTTNAITASGIQTNDFHLIGNGTVTGSFIISGSNTFKNIGPAQFTGSVDITGSGTLNGSPLVTEAVYNPFTASYYQDSASFDTRILNNSSSIDLLSGSYLNSSASFDSRILNNSSSITFLSGSYLNSSASFDTRILNNSSSIAILSGSFLNDSASFDTRILNNSSSIASLSGSYLNSSASFDIRILNNSSSIAYLSGSYLTDSSSFDTRILNNSSSIVLLSGSYLLDSASFSSRVTTNENNIASLTSKTGSYATTGSNTFIGNQIIDGNITVNGTASVALLYTTYQTSSIIFSSGSTKFGDTLDDTHQFTGSVTITGSDFKWNDDTVLTVTPFNNFTSSYLQDSASFDTRILNNSSSISSLSGSYLNSSASFDTRILTNSSSIALLSSSYETFIDIYNTGSFTGSFTGSLFGTASWANNAVTASYVNPLNQNVLISGSLKFDPTQDPDPSGLDLDSTVLFQSSSNTSLGYDLYIRQDGNLVKWKWVEGVMNTGLLYGGVVTYSGSNIFVSPGSGIIVNHNATTGSEISPIVEYVTWNAITQSVTNITTQQVTYLYIDNSGTLQQQSTRFTNEQYHDYIPLGAVGHFDFTQVSAFGGQVQTAYDQVAQISSFVDAFGPLKISGYGITGQTGDLKLSIGSGISFIHGGFYENDPELPSQISTQAQATASIAYVYRSGSGVYFDINGGAFYTDIDPTQWDDGSGVLQAVPGGSYTIQKVLTDPKTGILYVYYGQTVYGTQAEALSSVAVDQFTEGDTFDFTTLIGQLILKGNTSDITDTDNNIIPAGLFRGSGQGSGGGVAISNLDDLTDVSITGPTDGEALIYNAGVWQNGIPLNSTSASFASSGTGVFTGSFTGSFQGDGSQLTGIVSSKWSGSNPITRNSDVEITGSFKVTGQTTLYTTGSGTLKVQGSGSTQPLFLVTGSVGELLSVIDQDDPNEPLLIVSGSAGQLFVVENSTTGSLLQIYDSSSNSIFEINNDAEIVYGVSSSIFTTQYTTIPVTASYQTIYNIETGSYTGAFINYTVVSSSNARAGQLMSVWNSGTASYTETTTTDIGNTSQIAFDIIMTGSVAQIAVSSSLTVDWQVKTTLNIL